MPVSFFQTTVLLNDSTAVSVYFQFRATGFADYTTFYIHFTANAGHYYQAGLVLGEEVLKTIFLRVQQ